MTHSDKAGPARQTPMDALLPMAFDAELLPRGSGAEVLATLKAGDKRPKMSTIKKVALEQLQGVAVLWSYVSRRHNPDQTWQADWVGGWGPSDLMTLENRLAFDQCPFADVAERLDHQVIMVKGLLRGVVIAAQRDRDASRSGADGKKKHRTRMAEKFISAAAEYRHLDRDEAAVRIGKDIGLSSGTVKRYMSEFTPGRWKVAHAP